MVKNRKLIRMMLMAISGRGVIFLVKTTKTGKMLKNKKMMRIEFIKKRNY